MKRYCLLLSLLFLLSCNYYTWAYNHAEWILSWKLHHYLDLTAKQKPLAQAQMNTLANWHRSSQLPKLKKAVRRARKYLRQKKYAPGVKESIAAYKNLRDNLYQGFIQALVPILMELNPQQIDHLQEILEEENQEIRESLDDPAPERLAKRVAGFKSTLEDWLGDLSGQQNKMVEELFLRLPELKPLRLRYRKEQQAHFFAALRQKPEINALGGRLLKIWVQRPPQDPYGRALIQSSKTYEIFLIHLLKTTSPQQRSHLLKKMETLEKDLHSLLI